MSQAAGPLDDAILEIDRLRRQLKKVSSRQVENNTEREIVRAYSLAWTNSHRLKLADSVEANFLAGVDELYEKLHTASYRAISRVTYLSTIKDLRAALIELQKQIISGAARNTFAVPDFSPLAQEQMSSILSRRVEEVINSIDKAPLSATIMMGALLEALFLARVNLVQDKKPLFSLKTTPRDREGRPRELKDWGLNDYIEVGHEMGWIRKPAKDIGGVLRDYRNIIHPVKELTMLKEQRIAVLIDASDAKMFWRVFSELCEQITASAK